MGEKELSCRHKQKKVNTIPCKSHQISQLDPEVNFETELKLRPYGGIIGMDNSSLDTYLKPFKGLCLLAILHVSGFIAVYSQNGPGFSYVLTSPITNAYIVHLTGLFCMFVKSFKRNLFSLLEC